MKALLVGDIHLADRPPSIRTETYADDIVAKLEQTVELAEEHEVDFVVWAGDVFHVKTPSRTSHRLVQRAADIVKAYPVPCLIVPGNHDMQHDRLESLSSQPLGTLFKAGAAPLVGDYEGVVFGIPWLYDWRRELLGYMDRWQESEARLMVTHAPLVPPGQSRPYEVIDAEDWAELMGRFGDVYYGHIHDPDGAFSVDVDGEGWYGFCNQGAVSRGSVHESTLRRAPAVTVYDFERAWVRIELEHKPAREVFRLEEKELGEAKTARLDEFLTSVERTSFAGLTVEAVLAHVETLGVEQRTKELLAEVLEEVLSR